MDDGYIGEIRMFAGNFAPREWAFCEGQLLAISSNTALYSILGTTYGGDGRTTFGLPDLRGRYPIGTGQGIGLQDIRLGQQVGNFEVTLNHTNLPPHNHGVSIDANLTGSATTTAKLNASSANADTNTPATGNVLAKSLNPTGDAAPINIYSSGTPNAEVGGLSVTVNTSGLKADVNGSTADTGNGTPINIQNPSMGTNFIICINGIFPSRS